MLKKLTNPIWSIFEYGSYPLMLLVATPWFLRQLGPAQYGFWMLLNAVIGFGGALNTGTGAATIKEIASRRGNNSTGTASDAVRVSLTFALLGGALLAFIVAVFFGAFGTKIFAKMNDPASVMLTGYAACFFIILEQIDNVFSSVVKGSERFDIAARTEVACKLLQVLIAAITLIKFPTLFALFVSLGMTGIIRTTIKAMVVRRYVGLTDFRPSLNDAAGLFSFAKWGWIQGGGGILFSVADRLIIAALLGATSLSYYSIASQVAMQVHAVSAAGLSVIFPVTARKLASNHAYSIRQILKISLTANALLTSGLAIFVLLFCRFGLPIWLPSAQAAAVAEVLPLLTLAYWILGLNVTTHFLLLSLGEIKAIALYNLAAGIIFVSVLPLGVALTGLTGIAVARSFYGLVISANTFTLVKHYRQRIQA